MASRYRKRRSRYGRRRGSSRTRRSYRRRSSRKAPSRRSLRRRGRRIVNVTRTAPVYTGFGTTSFSAISQPTFSTFTYTGQGIRIIQGATTVSGTYYAAFAFRPRLNDVPDYTEFINMYDDYRLMKCTLKLKGFTGTATDDSNLTGTAGTMGLRIHTIIEHDGRTPFTLVNPNADLQFMMQYASYKNELLTTSWSRMFNPSVVIPVYTTPLSSGILNSGPKYRYWIDSNSAAVQHEGLYGIIEINGGTLGQIRDFTVEYECQFQLKNNI